MTNKPKLFNIKRLPMDFARIVASPLLLAFRMKRLTPDGKKYTEKIEGGAVIAANHSSMLDPFLVGTVFWYRRLFFLVAEAVMRNKFLAWLLKGVGAIRIDRNTADIEAIKKSVDVLKQGHLLSVFPQGSIQKEEAFNAIKAGAVLIALKADVPIIPVTLLPRKNIFQRRRAIIGKTVYPKDHVSGKFPSTADIEKITNLLMEEMRYIGE